MLLSTYTVTSLNDSGPGTLRDALTNSSADTITFAVTGTALLNSQLEITRNLTITGPGAGLLTVSGQNAARVFQIDQGSVAEIDGLTVTGGHTADGGTGAAGAAHGTGTAGGAGQNGGGVLNLGTLTLQNDRITANRAGAGGAGGAGGVGAGTASRPLDPRLSPLGDHGGPTQTMALLAGSPALDHGSNALAAAAGLTTDQRGLARVFNGTVDIGAYEAQPPAVAGDVNHDGTTGFADLLLLAQHYGAAGLPLFEGGDLNGDGSVSFADLLLLARNYGHTTAAGLVKQAGSSRVGRN